MEYQSGGMATDFNIWDSAMSDKDLIDWTTCKYIVPCTYLLILNYKCTCSRLLTKGSLINWEESIWSLAEGMEWIEKDLNDVCLLPQPKDIFFPEERSNLDTHILCNKLGGHLSVADGLHKQEILFQELKRRIPDMVDYLVSQGIDWGKLMS